MISFGKKKKNIVALDIGSYSVKLVELRELKRGYQLVNLDMLPLPPEAVVDGAIMDAGAIVEVVRSLFEGSKVKSQDVASSVSGHSVIIKKISLPAMTEEELADSIQWEAEQYIPFDIADVNLDFEMLDSASEDASHMDVLLVAAKKETVDDYTAVIAEAGLAPIILDIDAFAVQNMLEVNYSFEEGEVVAIANVGAELTNINIIKDGMSLFTRDVANGGGQFTEEIQKRFGVGYEEADVAKLGGQVEGVDREEMNAVVQEVAETLASEIARTIDFFMATNPEDKVGKAFMCGGGAKTKGLSAALAEKLGVEVEIADPFNAVKYSEKKFDPDYMYDIAPIFGVAVGLAIRKEGD